MNVDVFVSVRLDNFGCVHTLIVSDRVIAVILTEHLLNEMHQAIFDNHEQILWGLKLQNRIDILRTGIFWSEQVQVLHRHVTRMEKNETNTKQQ